jgi:hypothetical protein
MMGQVCDLQAALRDINDKNVEFQIKLTQKWLNTEDMDHARCEQSDVLKARMKIGYMHQYLQEENEEASKMQAHLDKQGTHRKMVFKQNDLEL